MAEQEQQAVVAMISHDAPRFMRQGPKLLVPTFVPFADKTHIKVPDSLTDEQVLFLGDIFPTGWQAAVQCDIEPTDTVVVWGCGPVGQMTIRSAVLLGAKQVVAIDCIPERLSMAEAGGSITIKFEDESVVERLNELTGGKGLESIV